MSDVIAMIEATMVAMATVHNGGASKIGTEDGAANVQPGDRLVFGSQSTGPTSKLRNSAARSETAAVVVRKRQPRQSGNRSVVPTAATAHSTPECRPTSPWLWARLLDPVLRSELLRALDPGEPSVAMAAAEACRTHRAGADAKHQAMGGARATVSLIHTTVGLLRSMQVVPIDAGDAVPPVPLGAAAPREVAADTDEQPSDLRVAYYQRDVVLARWWAAVEAFAGPDARQSAQANIDPCIETVAPNAAAHTQPPPSAGGPLSAVPRAAYESILARVAELVVPFEAPAVRAMFPTVTPVEAARRDFQGDTGGRLREGGVPRDAFLRRTLVAISRAWAPSAACGTELGAIRHDAAFLGKLLSFVFALPDEVAQEGSHSPAPLPSPDRGSPATADSRPASGLGRAPPPVLWRPRVYSSNLSPAGIAGASDDGAGAVKQSHFPARLPSAGLLRLGVAAKMQRSAQATALPAATAPASPNPSSASTAGVATFGGRPLHRSVAPTASKMPMRLAALLERARTPTSCPVPTTDRSLVVGAALGRRAIVPRPLTADFDARNREGTRACEGPDGDHSDRFEEASAAAARLYWRDKAKHGTHVADADPTPGDRSEMPAAAHGLSGHTLEFANRDVTSHKSSDPAATRNSAAASLALTPRHSLVTAAPVPQLDAKSIAGFFALLDVAAACQFMRVRLDVQVSHEEPPLTAVPKQSRLPRQGRRGPRSTVTGATVPVDSSLASGSLLRAAGAAGFEQRLAAAKVVLRRRGTVQEHTGSMLQSDDELRAVVAAALPDERSALVRRFGPLRLAAASAVPIAQHCEVVVLHMRIVIRSS